MNIICTICMRKGSKGIPNKNLKKINGEPLMNYTIKQAVSSKLFDNIIISSDCKKIKKNAENFEVSNFFLRPKKLSGDRVPKIDVIKHAVMMAEKKYKKEYDIIFDLDTTSPLRKVSDIKNALDLFIKDRASNLFSVCEARRNPYFNQVKKDKRGISLVKKSNKKIIRRQDTPQVFDMNASIYIWKRDYLFKSKTIFGRNTSLYVMPLERSIDIDNYSDFKIVNLLMSNK